MDVRLPDLRRALHNLGHHLPPPTPRPPLHSALSRPARTHSRHPARSREPARRQEPPLPGLPSPANVPRPKDVDPLHHGRRRAGAERRAHILHFDHRVLVRLRHSRDPVPADPWRCGAVLGFACRRLRVYEVAEQYAVHRDDFCK